VTTTPPDDLQVIFPEPDDLQVILPDELAESGSEFNWMLLAAMLLLITGAVTVAYSTIRRLATSRVQR
jgi:hypothetical protein